MNYFTDKEIIKATQKTLSEQKYHFTGTIFQEYERVGSTASKGIIGETIVKSIFEKKGFNVYDRTNTEHDLTIDQIRTEVKASIKHDGKKSYFSADFTHISAKHDFERIIYLSGHPHKGLFLRWNTKEELEKLVNQDNNMFLPENYSSAKYGNSYYHGSLGMRNQQYWFDNTHSIDSW